MNDQHPHAGYDAYATGSFDTDPLFGAMPGSYETGHVGHDGHSGQYDATQWNTGAAAGYDAYGAQTHQQAYPQQYDATPLDAAQYDATQYDTTGQWDANAWNQSGQFATEQFETAAATFGYDTTGQWTAPGYGAATSYETGAYDATAWNTGSDATATAYPQYTDHTVHSEHTAYAAYEEHQDLGEAFVPEQFSPTAEHDAPLEVPLDAPLDTDTEPEHAVDYEYEYEQEADPGSETGTAESAYDDEPAADTDTDTDVTPAVTRSAASARPVRRSGGRGGRRRTPAKRSALLTVAVPSVCVMGVAGVAAASVSGLTGSEDTKDDNTAVTAADPASVKPVAANSKLDTQLAALSADARDFGDRASRTQERIDLKARQAAERKKREEEAARREALRPKFALPVAEHGLSAYYGQAGVNWMSMHTGIDFPVSYGTPVLAATDGTVRTQWNSAYGNMAIVTAADGTETWYCHLSSTKIRSGTVKAGETIAYSGNSGNSTGPHLHFEVRPGGGSAIDPLSWLRSHGLNPT
ncbi:M23 family metallopeptidase [Streptomyces sp. NPDC055709]